MYTLAADTAAFLKQLFLKLSCVGRRNFWWFWMRDSLTISFGDDDALQSAISPLTLKAKRLSRALAKLSRPEAVKHFCPEVRY